MPSKKPVVNRSSSGLVANGGPLHTVVVSNPDPPPTGPHDPLPPIAAETTGGKSRRKTKPAKAGARKPRTR
jgi:hypothetical protein